MTTSADVLVVDDHLGNRQVVEAQLAAMGHAARCAENGRQALALLAEQTPDLMILDIMMPEMDGYEVLKRVKGSRQFRQIPVLVVSAVDDMESIIRCIRAGADDYLTKPYNSTLLDARVGACLERTWWHKQEREYQRQIEEQNRTLEERVNAQVRDITNAHLSTIFALSKLAEYRDPETGRHLERMREYCRALCREMQELPKYRSVIDVYIDNVYIDNVYIASPLHDIGKIGIPDGILGKRGALTYNEFEVMKTHTTIGAETLRVVNLKHAGNQFLQLGIEVAESHHERWNGAGYPYGLAGEDIPLIARIVAVADVYDALTSKRRYKEAFSHERSRNIILEERGRQFDPDVVDAFSKAEHTFCDIRHAMQDDPSIEDTLDGITALLESV
jgi:putative two-component system response regulator